MNDCNSHTSSKKNKLKTPFARIIVGSQKEKQYYNILYFDKSDNQFHVGFGSYILEYVQQWLEDELDITDEHFDYVPVVRCKDCKCLERKNGYNICDYLSAAVLDEWYCWAGEHRDHKETRIDKVKHETN